MKFKSLHLIIININSITVVIVVQLSNTTYSGSEESGAVPVTLLLGGTSPFPITVTVMPFNQSPVSAEGKRCVSSLIIS